MANTNDDGANGPDFTTPPATRRPLSFRQQVDIARLLHTNGGDVMATAADDAITGQATVPEILAIARKLRIKVLQTPELVTHLANLGQNRPKKYGMGQPLSNETLAKLIAAAEGDHVLVSNYVDGVSRKRAREYCITHNIPPCERPVRPEDHQRRLAAVYKLLDAHDATAAPQPPQPR